jgi:hypothetical protein
LDSAKDRQLQADLKEKDRQIAEAGKSAAEATKSASEAHERATKAQASLGQAEQNAAEANAKAEGFRRDIAQANERAAEANRIAEQERLARLQLEARLADRVLTPDGQAKLTALAASFPKGSRIDICTFGGTLEVANITQSISGALTMGGWAVQIWQVTGGGAARGILIGTSPTATESEQRAAVEIIATMNSLGMGGQIWKYDDLLKAANSGMRNGPMGAIDAPILVIVGSKQ